MPNQKQSQSYSVQKDFTPPTRSLQAHAHLVADAPPAHLVAGLLQRHARLGAQHGGVVLAAGGDAGGPAAVRLLRRQRGVRDAAAQARRAEARRAARRRQERRRVRVVVRPAALVPVAAAVAGRFLLLMIMMLLLLRRRWRDCQLGRARSVVGGGRDGQRRGLGRPRGQGRPGRRRRRLGLLARGSAGRAVSGGGGPPCPLVVGVVVCLDELRVAIPFPPPCEAAPAVLASPTVLPL